MIARDRRTFAVAFAALSLLATHRLAAQDLADYRPLGSDVREAPQAITDKNLRSMMRIFSKCVYSRQVGRSSSFLHKSDNLAVSPDVGNPSDFLLLSTCLKEASYEDYAQVGAQVSITSLRDWLAEYAYLAKYPKYAPLATDASPPVARVYFSQGAELAKARTYDALADCVVASDPESADRILRTSWASDEEGVAARALVPALGTCIEAGQKFAFLPQNVRGVAAQGLWHSRVRAKPTLQKGER